MPIADIEEKVQYTLKLLQEEGDSFAKRADMYYRRRPELISFVEEAYKAYRALAERYDHLSSDLQNANNTIASVFPDQVQFPMDDDDDDGAPRMQKKAPQIGKLNIPKVPDMPKEVMGRATSTKKKLLPSKSARKPVRAVKSGLSKTEGVERIDKLQKQILGLQTEKEFVKSSYEGQLAKYWDIENQIADVQKEVCGLQDEFGEGIVIEDDEARTLMARAAINSCQATLARLEEKQGKSAEQAQAEGKKLKDFRVRLTSFKPGMAGNETSKQDVDEVAGKETSEREPEADDSNKAVEDSQKEEDLEALENKLKQHFEVESSASLSVTEMAEKIDELVNKVVSLETAESSHTALLQTLQKETDELQAQIRELENDKANLIDGKNELNTKLIETEEKLVGLQEHSANIDDQSNNLISELQKRKQEFEDDKARLIDEKNALSIKLVEMEEKLLKLEELHSKCNLEKAVKTEEKSSVQSEEHTAVDVTSGSQVQKQQCLNLPEVPVTTLPEEKNTSLPEESRKDVEKARDVQTEQVKEVKGGNQAEVFYHSKENGASGNQHQDQSSQNNNNQGVSSATPATPQDDEPDWKQLFMKGMENKEKTLLAEYTTVLRNYKELKKQLNEGNKRTEDSKSEATTTTQARDLTGLVAKKDEEIQSLRRKLSLLDILANDADNKKREAEEDEDIKVIEADQEEISPIEERFRSNIDELLEENLDFWLRFSSTFHQIQKFENEVKDLQAEVLKLEEKQHMSEASGTDKYSIKSDGRPLYKHLNEIQAELTMWMEKGASLKEELKSRFSALCNIQEDITKALKASAEDYDFKFTSYQAAKFQGEVLNMKQENNKVADELQAGIDHVTNLQIDVERSLGVLSEEFGMAPPKSSANLERSDSKTGRGGGGGVPLRSFIFGVKPKKQKTSFFSCMHPALQKKYNRRI